MLVRQGQPHDQSPARGICEAPRSCQPQSLEDDRAAQQIIQSEHLGSHRVLPDQRGEGPEARGTPPRCPSCYFSKASACWKYKTRAQNNALGKSSRRQRPKNCAKEVRPRCRSCLGWKETHGSAHKQEHARIRFAKGIVWQLFHEHVHLPHTRQTQQLFPPLACLFLGTHQEATDTRVPDPFGSDVHDHGEKWVSWRVGCS